MAPGERFQTTRWSQVLAARSNADPESGRALEALCTAYWQPLYAYLRRLGHQPDDAADLTQGFFATLIEKRFLDDVDPARGRFRSFMLASLKHFVGHERDRARTLKRGGGRVLLSFDALAAEAGYLGEPRDDCTAETIFERRWASTLVDRALGRLRGEMEQAGKGEAYRLLQPFLIEGGAERSQREVARELGTTEAALGMAILRQRRRLGRLLREEVADTVRDPPEVESELRHLLSVLRER